MTTEKITVHGMNCNHCKESVEKAVANLNGVTHAEVNLDQNTLLVSYDENMLTIANITEAVTEAGYSPA